MRFGIDNLEILEIKQAGDLVKDVDKGDLESNYLAEAIGLRSLGDNYIASRDYGTRHRFTSPPIRPNASIAITGATNATPIVLSTANTDGLQAGDTIYVDEVQGNTGANGTWVVGTVVANTSIELVGSVGNGAYTASTGIWCSPDTDTVRNPITIIDGTTFYDKESQVEYEIIVGLDSAGMTRLFVYDETATAGQRWIELTRKIDCLINEPVSIGASDQTFDIDTITENSITLAPATNLVQYWICYNVTKLQTVFITASTATSLTVDTIIGSSGLGWANNEALELYKFPAIKFNWTYDNGTTPDFDWMQIEQQRKLTMLYTNSATPKAPRQPIQIMKRAARNYFHNGSSYLLTLPAGWYVESDYGILNPFTVEQGSVQSPTTNTKDYKSITGATNATPIVVTTGSAHGYSNGDKVIIHGVATNTNANGSWTIANVTGTTFELVNSVGNGVGTGGIVMAGTSNEIYNKISGRNWLEISIGEYISAPSNVGLRIFITVLFGYQESDPIFAGYYYGAGGIGFNIAQKINFALMNKEITGINVYVASANSTIYAAGWAEATSEFYLIGNQYDFLKNQFPVQDALSSGGSYTWYLKNNKISNHKPYALLTNSDSIIGYVSNMSEYMRDAGQINLNDALNHAVDKNRTYPTPSFVTKGTRDQGSIIAINEGDTKLHISLYDGYGVHQDDNFPDVATDNNGNKMLVQMLGSSELLGLEILYDTIFAFRSNMIETFDLSGVPKRTYDADVVSKKSITVTPYGIVYAGRSSIFIIPSDGSEIRTLNELWNNYYGGNQYVDGTSTQFITDAYRTAIIGGYDMTFKEACLLIKVNNATTYDFILFRYNFDDRKWRQRILNTTDTIKYFTKRQIDGTFTVGLSKGLLKYPNRAGTYPWQDDVRINGDETEISQSKAVPFTFTINIARFNNEIIENIVHGFIVSHFGNSTGKAGLMKVELFANNETVAFDTQYISVDRRMDYRTVDRRGNIERLKIKFTMPDSSIFGQYDMSKITLGFLSGTKIGNL